MAFDKGTFQAALGIGLMIGAIIYIITCAAVTGVSYFVTYVSLFGDVPYEYQTSRMGWQVTIGQLPFATMVWVIGLIIWFVLCLIIALIIERAAGDHYDYNY